MGLSSKRGWVVARVLRHGGAVLAVGLSVAIALAPAQALAACSSAGGGNFVCADANLNGQAIVNLDAAVTTLPGFGIDTTLSGGVALSITGDGTLSYVDVAASPLTSDDTALDVLNNGGGAGVITIDTNGALLGVNYGVMAQNYGLGATSVRTRGRVAASAGYGLLAVNTTGTGDLTIETGDVSGGQVGIFALNFGAGALRLTTTGTVSGLANIGIVAQVGPGNTGGIFIDTQAVSGRDGIGVINMGLGATSIRTRGTVTATGGVAINASVTDTTNANDLALDLASAIGAQDAIFATNSGTGAIAITASGALTGSANAGVELLNSNLGNTGGVRIDAQAISGGFYGVLLVDDGRGATAITTRGAVNGALGHGMNISLTNALNAGGVSIDAQSVRGGIGGIVVDNNGTGATSIAVDGLVEGQNAIVAYSDSAAAIDITINGEARTLSRAPTALVIRTDGGATTLHNGGQMTGSIWLSDVGNSVTNAGMWTTRGTSQFGGGIDQMLNQVGGNLIVAQDAGMAETTRFANLDSFFGGGMVTLADGGAGDLFVLDGTAVFDAGAVQASDIGAAGIADLIAVGGTADISNLSLRVSQAGNRVLGDSFAVLATVGGLAGQYLGIVDLGATAYLAVTDSYDLTTAYLHVVQTQALSAPARTPNQIATVGAIETLGLTNPVVGALFNGPTDAAARAALDVFSGDMHASVRSGLLQDSHLVRDAIIAQLRAGFADAANPATPVLGYSGGGSRVNWSQPELAQIWGHGFGNWNALAGDGNAGALRVSGGGVMGGADMAVFDDWRIGLMGAFGSSSFASPDRAASGHDTAYHIGLYGGTEWGNVAFRSGLVLGWNDISTRRNVTLPGLSETLTARYGGATMQGFGELAYQFEANGVDFEPFANIAYVDVRTDGFAEQGGAAALNVASGHDGAAFTKLGLRAASRFIVGEATLVSVKGMLGWTQSFGKTPAMLANFAGSNSFAIAGVPVEQGAVVAEAGIDLSLTDSASLDFGYSGRFGGNLSNHSVNARLGISF